MECRDGVTPEFAKEFFFVNNFIQGRKLNKTDPTPLKLPPKCFMYNMVCFGHLIIRECVYIHVKSVHCIIFEN